MDWNTLASENDGTPTDTFKQQMIVENKVRDLLKAKCASPFDPLQYDH